MNKKQFIQAFFKATHIDNNYSSYEKFLETGNCNCPAELDYIQEIVLPTICMNEIIENFNTNTDIYDFELKYLKKYNDYDNFIKNGYDILLQDYDELYDADYYLQKKELYDKYSYYSILDKYYDEQYDIYYTENGYFNVFTAFLKKYDLEKIYEDSDLKEFSILEFILKYQVNLDIKRNNPIHNIIRREDIKCINLNMNIQELESYIIKNKLEQNLLEFVRKNDIEYILDGSILKSLV